MIDKVFPENPAPPGFTLLELLVSLVVLGIGCLAAVAMQTNTMESGARAYSLTVGSFLAESEIERLKTLSYGQAKAASSSSVRLTRDGETCPNQASPNDSDCYTRSVTVVPKAPSTQNLWVSIKVEFPKSTGITEPLFYDTLLFYFDFV